jgi:hypothetical protein
MVVVVVVVMVAAVVVLGCCPRRWMLAQYVAVSLLPAARCLPINNHHHLTYHHLTYHHLTHTQTHTPPLPQALPP